MQQKKRDEKTLKLLHSRARRNEYSVISTLTPVDGVLPAY